LLVMLVAVCNVGSEMLFVFGGFWFFNKLIQFMHLFKFLLLVY
jgi:hypothetical protein